ncbi:MAG: hypothetical protein KAY24_19715 [Candidatus Eisenbacteria sp.]|nr:hypothetical protein [Candidatus Eisenbacteria bacterium]
MPAGKSYGVDRKYQELCRDIMVERDSSLVLVPYDGDGIDVPLQLGTSQRTFDVALVDQEGRLVVAECRRTKNPVKLYDLDAFAYRVELLRRNSACEVAGVYFAKTGYQEGAVKAAGDSGIQAAVCAQDQEPSSFLLVFHRYDAARHRRLRHCERQLRPAVVSVGATVDAKIIRADGTVENLGRIA